MLCGRTHALTKVRVHDDQPGPPESAILLLMMLIVVDRAGAGAGAGGISTEASSETRST